MAFKLFIFAAVVMIVKAGVVPYKAYHHEGPMDAIAETKEHVVRNFAGTVASQSKAIHTPYASVHKQDTRITNNNNNYNYNNKYTSSGAESDYASYEPHYNHHAHAHEQHTTQAPTYHHEASSYHHAAPTYQHEAPAYQHEAPAYHHESPAYHHAAPAYQQEHSTAATPVYQHGPTVHTYNHNDHAISEYGSSQKVHYSPANMVSHMSFDGFGTHWGF